MYGVKAGVFIASRMSFRKPITKMTIEFGEGFRDTRVQEGIDADSDTFLIVISQRRLTCLSPRPGPRESASGPDWVILRLISNPGAEPPRFHS
jgi:hypothetical protein